MFLMSRACSSSPGACAASDLPPAPLPAAWSKLKQQWHQAVWIFFAQFHSFHFINFTKDSQVFSQLNHYVELPWNKGAFAPAGGVIAGGPKFCGFRKAALFPDGQARREKSAGTHPAPALPRPIARPDRASCAA